MYEQYEKAVLEWFNNAYPVITQMIYADNIDVLLAKERTIIYPALLYSRESASMLLSKAIPYRFVDEAGHPRESVMFHVPQEYTARLYVNDEAQLYKVANILRQRWYKESYLTLRYPTADDQMRVGMRLYNFKMESERTSVDTKGPQRQLVMHWRSDLVLEALYSPPTYTGYRIFITPQGDGKVEADLPIISTCPGDTCTDGSCEV